VSHASCNLAAGAQKVNGTRRREAEAEKPYRWSQRWFDDPPVGTINYDAGRDREIHTGDGNWQPLDSTSS
jgi:hypothetical protein